MESVDRVRARIHHGVAGREENEYECRASAFHGPRYFRNFPIPPLSLYRRSFAIPFPFAMSTVSCSLDLSWWETRMRPSCRSHARWTRFLSGAKKEICRSYGTRYLRIERLGDGNNNRLVSYTGRRRIIGQTPRRSDTRVSDLILPPPTWHAMRKPREIRGNNEIVAISYAARLLLLAPVVSCGALLYCWQSRRLMLAIEKYTVLDRILV